MSNLNQRINILAIFLHTSQWGLRIRGDERRFLELAKRFITLGAKLIVIEFAPSIQKSYYKTDIYTSIELRNKGLLSVILQLIYLARKLKNINVIYVYNQDFSNLLAGLIFKLITFKPLVLVIQSLQDVDLPLRVLRQIYGAGAVDLILISLHRYLLLPLALRLANAVFTVSKTLKDRLTLRYPWIKGRVYVTLNGVDLDKFKPLNLEKIYDAIFLGRIHVQHKGIDKLLLAWKQIVRKYPRATLILVGGFESERDRKILDVFVKKLNLEKNIIVTGFVEDYEVVSFLNKARFFISLSTYEGFGLSLLEALVCNVPAIVSDLEVFRELHGNLVFYVNAKDIKELVTVMERIMFSPYNILVNESFTRALQSHVKKFSWDLVATKEFAILKTISLGSTINKPKTRSIQISSS